MTPDRVVEIIKTPADRLLDLGRCLKDGAPEQFKFQALEENPGNGIDGPYGSQEVEETVWEGWRHGDPLSQRNTLHLPDASPNVHSLSSLRHARLHLANHFRMPANIARCTSRP